MIPLWLHHLLSVFSFLLTLAFISSILRSRRAPGSTVAWLFVICVIPYVGIPLYLIFSGRKFKHGLSGKREMYFPPHSPAQDLSEHSSTQRILQASGVPEARGNHLLELLPTGVRAYESLIQLIREAQSSIYITTFIFGKDDVGRAIVEALAEKAAAGIEVRVLVDSLGATLIRHPSFSPLLQAGGRIAYFMPLLHIPFRGRSNLRNHRKLMLVDRRIAVLGGMNLAREYLGPSEDPKRWVDLALRIEGNSVRDLEEIFLQDWSFATGKAEATATPTLTSSGDILSQVVASGPDVAGDPLYDVLLSAIHQAQKSIWVVTPYFIPDESLAKALDIAAKRGVNVRVLIPRNSNHRLADLARGTFVRQLLAAGVHFGFYPKMIHAKAVLIDGSMAIVGSANLDMRSLLLNYELGLVIYSEPVLYEIESWIEAKYAETDAHLEKPGIWRDLAEGIGRVVGPLL